MSATTFNDDKFDETMLSALNINPSRAKCVINDTKKKFKVFHIDEDDGEFIITGKHDYAPKFEKYIVDICRAFKIITNDSLTEVIRTQKDNRLIDINNSRFMTEDKNLAQKAFDICKMMDRIPQLSLQAFKDGCPILYNINRTINDWVADNMVIIREGFDIQYEMGNINKVTKGQVSILINRTMDEEEKGDTMKSCDKHLTKIYKYLNEYITKWEYIIHAEFLGSLNSMKECIKMELVEEEKVVTKSKSQLKKEKAREANKRREQEKADKIKRQEKEAKYLEQKRKEAERKRIAVCRAKRK